MVEASEGFHRVKYKYSPMGDIFQREGEDGSVLRFAYDRMDRLRMLTNEHGEKYTFDRNLRGEIIGETGFDRMHRKYMRDRSGRVIREERAGGRWTEYEYDQRGRLTRSRTTYAYDAVGSLMSARYEDDTDDYRMPDAADNIFRSRDRRDREYGKGGRILRDRHYDYLYDVEGNLMLKTPRRGLTQHPNHEVSEESGTHIAWQTGDYAYEWYGNGMLKEVRLPYGKTVRFEYDTLGCRTAKHIHGDFHLGHLTLLKSFIIRIVGIPLGMICLSTLLSCQPAVALFPFFLMQ